ncbi:hypothetical protein ACJMK2_030999 [Sinanodonta woodiana]|uniref:Mitochondria-eating protein n=1 Tax=Sinanodonta woodiana TaxID=1069815 RepID=A0ABD3X1G5_SINWO
MSGVNISNVALELPKRPGSARYITVQHDLNFGQNGQDGSARRAENVDWETKYMELKGKYDTLALQIKEKPELEDKIPAQFKTTDQISSEQTNELVLLRQRVESGDKDLKDLNQKLQECLNDLELKEKKLKIQQRAMEEVQKEKDDALIRLSRQMGQQMSEGNPVITDLSDQNRPCKLGEMYSEMYDNEWTDAFEALNETFKLDAKRSIKLLLQMLWESSNHASDLSQSAMKKIENLLSGSSDGVTPECRRLLREARKHVDIKKADSIFQDFREKLTILVNRRNLKDEKVDVYIKKCFQLCWLMSIQDPPVVLSREPERGDQFDTNLYKYYMNSGDNIDYVIWPALLLHKDGPLVAKGVAEPCAIPETKGAPATVNDDISLNKKSQMEPDGNVRESNSGPDAPFSSKSSYSPKVTQTYPVDKRKNIVHSETTSIRGKSPASKNNMAFDKRSQIEHDSKAREPKSGSSKIETTQYGNDVSSSLKSRHSPIVKPKPKHPVDERKYTVNSAKPARPGQGMVSKKIQLFEHDGSKSKLHGDSS